MEPPLPRPLRSMDNVPDELLEQILAQLDQDTLFECLFASKRVSRIATPLLYRVITHHMYTKPSKLQSAIRTLLRQPELQSKVEAIVLRDPVVNHSFWNLESWAAWARFSYDSKLDENNQALFSQMALHNGQPSTREMEEYHNEEVQAALLINLAPNLTYLHLENPMTGEETPRFSLDHLILEKLYPKIRDGTILQNLRTLHVATSRLEGGQGGSRLSAISTFLMLPKLTRVVCVACYEPEDDLYRDFDIPDDISNIKHMRFVRSSICPPGLKQMLELCSGIEDFDCDWAGSSVGWVEVNFPLLLEALYKHRCTLNRLRLDTRKHFDSWPERDNGLVPPLGADMQEYTQLRILEVPASALVGWDEENVGGYEVLQSVLPPNIEELKINEYTPRFMEALNDFIPVASGRYPKLKKITLSRVELDAEEDRGAEERLKQAFSEYAQDMSIIFQDGSDVDHFEESIDSESFC